MFRIFVGALNLILARYRQRDLVSATLRLFTLCVETALPA
jgi:hypothetical protein